MNLLIDMEACTEFMQETLSKIDREELVVIADQLKDKSGFFKEHLSKESIPSLKERELTELFKKIFVTRRRSKLLLEKYSAEQFKSGIMDLLYGRDDVEVRFQKFIDDFREIDIYIRFDMAAELLHYTNPEKYWLWSRWLWDPKSQTGALTLVTNEEYNMTAATYGQMYLNVGKAVAFVHSMAEAVEFQFINRTLFGTDVYLSCVYVIYAYTILKIKMTDEFNKVMPGLSEFSRRILGIYNSKKMTVVQKSITTN